MYQVKRHLCGILINSQYCLMTPNLCQSLWNLNRTRFGCEVSGTILGPYRPSRKMSPFPLCSNEQSIIPLSWDHRCLQSGFLMKSWLCKGVYTHEFDWSVLSRKASLREQEKQHWATGKVELWCNCKRPQFLQETLERENSISELSQWSQGGHSLVLRPGLWESGFPWGGSIIPSAEGSARSTAQLWALSGQSQPLREGVPKCCRDIRATNHSTHYSSKHGYLFSPGTTS